MPETFDVKLIRHNAANVNEPDDKSYPFVLDMNCSPPSFLDVAFVMINGGSEIVRVRGKTREAIVGFTKHNILAHHPRLRTLTISEETAEGTVVLYSINRGDQVPAELSQKPWQTGT